MLFSDINPFIRFAETIHYESSGTPVCVRDCRIFYILTGEAELRIGEQMYSLCPNSVFYCCAGSRYTIASAGVELIALNFDLSQSFREWEHPYSPVRLSPAAAVPPANCVKIEDQDFLNRHLYLPDGMACLELLERILEEFTTQRILYRETVSALLKALLVRLCRRSLESTTQAAKAVQRIIDHINAHYDQPLTNQLFSSLSGYHEYYLNRLFTKHTGSTIHQYILNVRISHAKKLLLNTDLPLAAIGEKVGFNSNTYFSSYFRQITGQSPTVFRRKYKNSI